MLINKLNHQRIWEHEFKAAHPSTSFPEIMTDAALEGFDHAVLHYPIQPVVTDKEVLTDDGHEDVDGQWQVKWLVRDKTVTELEADSLTYSAQIRATRDSLLTACDWTQVADGQVANKQEWVDFRQALRDISAQVGFPFEVEWPVAPY